MPKIADLTCKIMRNFLFQTYSSFYVCLQHAIYVLLLLFDEMGQIIYFTADFFFASAASRNRTSTIAAGFIRGSNSILLIFSGC